LRVVTFERAAPVRSASAKPVSAVSTRVRRLATNSVASCGWAMAA
jgi:hypothetical protein